MSPRQARGATGLAWGAMSEAAARTGRVGVREVARAAGVSSQTVSRVINDHPSIRPETRRRVLEAMEALEYRRQQRGPRSRHPHDPDARRHRLGCDALRAVGRHRGARGGGSRGRPLGRDGVRGRRGRGIRPRRGRAAPRTGGRRDRRARPARRDARDPRGAARRGFRSARCTADGPSAQADAAALAVGHLAELGHRRIALLAGPGGLARGARARARAWRERSPSAGSSLGPRWEGDWSGRAGAAIAPPSRAAVREPDGPTAVFAANDQMALGLIAGLAEAGLDVPRDVSVAGFDDNPDAAFYRPALTTVHLDLDGEAGACVAEVLGLRRPAPPGAAAARSSARPPPRPRAET